MCLYILGKERWLSIHMNSNSNDLIRNGTIAETICKDKTWWSLFTMRLSRLLADSKRILVFGPYYRPGLQLPWCSVSRELIPLSPWSTQVIIFTDYSSCRNLRKHLSTSHVCSHLASYLLVHRCHWDWIITRLFLAEVVWYPQGLLGTDELCSAADIAEFTEVAWVPYKTRFMFPNLLVLLISIGLIMCAVSEKLFMSSNKCDALGTKNWSILSLWLVSEIQLHIHHSFSTQTVVTMFSFLCT